MAIALLTSSAQYSEASQIVGTVNYVIQQINSQALLGSTAPTSLRNALIGADFGVNPWQRGTTFTGITSTATYTADRFWAIGGGSSSISVSKQTGTPVPGFTAHARFGRAAANADVTAIKFGQVMTSAHSTRFQGQPFVISFWARAGATFSAASNALSVNVATGTGTDDTTANFAAGSWAGQASVTLFNSTGASGSTATLTTAFQRFSFSGVIPVAATQIGFNIAYTPVGTAGATDFVEIGGFQLEVMPQGGVTPTPFEWRPAMLEKALCQSFFYRVSEPIATVKQFLGQVNTTTQATILVPFPTTMRASPTTSVATTTATIGSYTLTGASGGPTSSLSTFVVTAGSPTVDSMNLTATIGAAVLVAGNVTYLVGGAGAGTISADAEL